ncbi:MAG: glycosyltransferase family A protein [Anaerolineales bacterium]
MPAKQANKPLVSIIIRAFNEQKHLGKLLEVIKQQTFRRYEIVLVDSGSTDRTLAIAASYPVKILHIKPGDFTFGRSLNLGLRAARGRLVVVASAHVQPLSRDWLKQLVAPFEDPKVAVAYGKQRGGAVSRFSETQHFLRWFPQRSNLDQPSAYCNNANLALRRSLWKKQPFNETLTGLEDLAWASVWRERGYKVAYVAEAGVTHIHEESSAQIINRHRREAIALKRILPSSRFTLWHFVSLFLHSTYSDFGAALRQRAFFRQVLGIISFRFLQYLGTYRGYRDAVAPSAKLKQVFYYPPGSLEDRSQQTNTKSIKEQSRKSAKA